MRYASIRKMDISNGQGVGISLFVQGCHFHCKGCFNYDTWDFSGGKEWTEEIENEFINLADHEYIARISILGGEPLADENIREVTELIDRLNARYPNKKIWVYTGYTFEELSAANKVDYISKVDVLVDGRFMIEKQDLYNESIVFAGSTNQRIIDIQKTIEQNKIVEYKREV